MLIIIRLTLNPRAVYDCTTRVCRLSMPPDMKWSCLLHSKDIGQTPRVCSIFYDNLKLVLCNSRTSIVEVFETYVLYWRKPLLWCKDLFNYLSSLPSSMIFCLLCYMLLIVIRLSMNVIGQQLRKLRVRMREEGWLPPSTDHFPWKYRSLARAGRGEGGLNA